jgi:hypothetical protein
MKDVIDPVEVMCWAMVRASGVPTARKLNEDPAWRYHEPAIRAALTAASEAGWVFMKREVLAWTDEVYPATNPESDGAIVHMTWEQFNAMRESIGLKSRKPPRAAMLSAASEASGKEAARAEPKDIAKAASE